MDYLSLVFYLFILIFLSVYFIVPSKYRYIPIALGSYVFYGYADLKLLIVLVAITVITYIGGALLAKKRSKGIYILFFCLTISFLIVFKYTNFILQNINLIRTRINIEPIADVNILLPIGLSFIVFQACTYLGDVYKNNVDAERNFVRYAAFVAFFPTVLAGPIQKARELLPQIACPKDFDSEDAKKGTILFIWGVFEKIMVADRLSVFIDKVYADYTQFNSAYYILAGVGFSIFIYADFSSYSDMARGIAKIMGIDVGKNFNNPFLSKTTSELWSRWHISLNNWFVEYIYIPLGGNRKGKLRKYVNVLIVFLVSGLWHGASYHYIVWGLLCGILVIIGQVIKPVKSKIYDKLQINENAESIAFCKRAIVFWLFTLTVVFFKCRTFEAIHIVKDMIFFSPIHFFDNSLWSACGTVTTTIVTVVAAIVFIVVQIKRQNESMEYSRFSSQAFGFQILLLAVLICICVFGACSTDAVIDSQFVYFQF